MTWTASVLVVANRTLDAPELEAALAARSSRSRTRFTLLVPATGGTVARANLDAACARLRDAGLELDGRVGDPDPIVAVKEAWDPAKYDEIVISTLPTGASHWLHLDLPQRVERMTGVPVTHVVGHEKRPEPATKPPPEHHDWTALLPKAVREPGN
jgi:hypothetical protein